MCLREKGIINRNIHFNYKRLVHDPCEVRLVVIVITFSGLCNLALVVKQKNSW